MSSSTRQRLTPEQAAQRLGLSLDAVRGRIKRGSLPSERVGRQVFVLVDVTAETAPATPSRDQSPDQSRPIAPASRDESRPVEAGAEELAALRATVEEMRARIEAGERHRESLRETIEDQRRRLDGAERERAELRQLLAAAVVSAQMLPPASQPTAPAPERDSEPGRDDQSGSRPAQAPGSASQRPVGASWWRRWLPGWA